MSELYSSIRDEQERMHAYITSAFPGYRLELDRNGESILWIQSAAELLSVVERVRRDSELSMDRLSDITAYDNIDKVDGPQRFVMVYQLYSMSAHTRLRLKLLVDEDMKVPSLTGFWKGANWLEREVFDLFGVSFANHPDLRRILMDERFVGHPLRKEYDLEDRQPFPDSLPVRIAKQGRLEDPNDE
jgi:NADH:ubiquinone oxidoreductase subunit C